MLPGKQKGGSMIAVYGVIVFTMLFIFFLPITDARTVRMKLCVLCALAAVLTVSVKATHLQPQSDIASLVR
jgi:hypothetical protein